MKVLHLNHHLPLGGAARAAIRLNDSLIAHGVESSLYAISCSSGVGGADSPNLKIGKAIAKAASTIDRSRLTLSRYRPQALFSPGWFTFPKLIDTINKSNADIVHLHWVTAGMLGNRSIAKITKPLVWSLHDMHPFTGGCHYDQSCGKFQAGCGQCPVLGSRSSRDLSSSILRQKIKAVDRCGSLTVVGLSRWMEAQARASEVFGSTRIVQLPNPINIDTFKPVNRDWARTLLNLPANRFLILFGAMSATSDPRKGYLQLREALDVIPPDKADLVVFGASRPAQGSEYPHRTHYLGQLYDEATLCSLYSACDVVVVPSLQENLSNTIMEALACAAPVVAFNLGGNPDMISHLESGFLAPSPTAESLAEGLRWALAHANEPTVRSHARNTVCTKFSASIVAKQYYSLYQSILTS